MNTVYGFKYEDTVYLVLATEGTRRMRSDTNVVSRQTAVLDNAMVAALLSETVTRPANVFDIPMLQVSEVSKNGSFFILKGTLDIAGTVYDVTTDAHDSTFTAREADVPAKAASSYPALNLRIGNGRQAGIQLGIDQVLPIPQQLSVDYVMSSMTGDQLKEMYHRLARMFDVKPQEQKKEKEPVANMPEPASEPAPMSKKEMKDLKREKFLESVRPEIAAVLRDLPYEIIRRCTASTSRAIDLQDVVTGGEEYCQANNWQLCRDYFAIDNLVTMERYFYNRVDGTATAIAMSIVQKWGRILSE